MLFFGQRKKLADKYEKWIKDNPIIKDSPQTVISYLCLHDLLNKEAVMKFLQKED